MHNGSPSGGDQRPFCPSCRLKRSLSPACDYLDGSKKSRLNDENFTEPGRSSDTVNGIGNIGKLPSELRALIYQLVDCSNPWTKLPVHSRCRAPYPLRAISHALRADVDSLYKCNHTSLALTLDPMDFEFTDDIPSSRMVREVSFAPTDGHEPSNVQRVDIMLGSEERGRYYLRYQLQREQQTAPRSPDRVEHEHVQLILIDRPEHDIPNLPPLHRHLHVDADRTLLRKYMRILEAVVHASLCAIFAHESLPNRSAQALCKIIGVLDGNDPSYSDMQPGLLNFTPGQLSDHLYALWIGETECPMKVILFYRLELKCQSADGSESTEEYWLDDGKPLTTTERQWLEQCKASWHFGERCALDLRLLEALWSSVFQAQGPEILPSPFHPYINSGKERFAKEIAYYREEWDVMHSKSEDELIKRWRNVVMRSL